MGQKEAEEGLVSVRSRLAGDEGQKSLDAFIGEIRQEIDGREVRKREEQ